ncbi:hypothetical protein DL89DRAFT_315704 [Linderina pennispora]|uniref:Uncharacterized protein n=1 Tax=Linderina pennispora TaxID=61395 RepID=A0A1Y1WBK7_9FUNG|nr:uncharacterized protein DL89DRAFT_315704 [Linderina pennispora]ORX70930.1 hypothetical protein DL89DRAFT_315704 [Linderina pennispora]
MGRAVRNTRIPRHSVTYKALNQFRNTTVHLIHTHTKRGSYDTASRLLLSTINGARAPLQRIWQPFLDTLRQQQPARSLAPYLDLMHTVTHTQWPQLCMFERIFLEILELGSMRRAYDIMTVFVQEAGSGSAMAHALYGLLTVSLREDELQLRTKVKGDLERIQGCLPLAKEDVWTSTRFTLMDAESHLFRALQIDPDCDFVKPAYVQVLVALGRQEDAEAFVAKWLEDDQSLLARRAAMQMGQVGLESALDYIQADPFALSADRFSGIIKEALHKPEDIDQDVLKRMIRVVVDAIDVGNSQDKFAWKCLARLLAHFSATDPCERDRAIDGVWECWMSTHLCSHSFVFGKKPSHMQVYKAVCLNHLSDLSPDHPAQLLLCNSNLSRKQLRFAKQNLQEL